MFYSPDYLRHYGVLGMKWGKIRASENQYRKKLSNISNSKSAQDSSDAKRFAYRNNNLATRVGKTASTVAAQILIRDILTGKVSGYGKLSKKELASKLVKLGSLTAANVAINDALAKSASKRYTENGHKINGSKNKGTTKEDAIQTGVNIAIKAAPIAKLMLYKKASDLKRDRERNEEIFKKWGSNILTDKVTNYVWNVDYKVV